MTLPTVHVLYENPDWMPPLRRGLEAEGFDYREVELESGLLAGQPEPGIYLNRISPSSHTRGHDRSVPLAREVLAWLESHGRRVVNGLRAFELEMSKFRQYRALRRHGIRTPRTVLAVGADEMVEAAETVDGPFITKHNRGGKGLGIERFDDAGELADRLDREPFDAGPDEQVLIQEYVDPPEPHITRVELVGGEMVLAMRSSTEEGLELCPSDACQAQQAGASSADEVDTGEKFAPAPLSADDPLVAQYRSFCAEEGIEVAGIEFVEDADGRRYTYDVNGTTNYNEALGEQIGVDGILEVARYLKNVVAPEVEGPSSG
ncbi:MAG: RimK family alpha-L-glutamate ligase [Bradymonadaceae bacterium]